MARKWTEEHKRIFSKYAKYGYKSIQRNILKETVVHFTIRALRHHAYRNMIEVGIGKNEVPLVWLGAKENGHAYKALMTAANRDGVLRKSKSKGGKYVVPIEWADRIAEIINSEGLEGVKKYNKQNRAKKGRNRNAEEIRHIRENPKKLSALQLAKKYDLHPETIRRIQAGRRYKDVK